MLVLPNMEPTHHAHGSAFLTRALLRHANSIATRLSILLLKVVAAALAMLFIPRTIHTLVQCLDDIYELLDRRATSPWKTQSFTGYGAIIGLVVMVVLHYLLFQVGCYVILDEDSKTTRSDDGVRLKKSSITWERVLMRIIVPMFLYGGLCMLVWSLWRLSGNENEKIRANTVDLTDDAGTRLVWRNR